MISCLSAVLISMMFLISCGEPKVTVESVIEQLKESGLPIEYSIVYTSENDPNGSGKKAYLQKGNFADSTIESEYSKDQPLSGSVEVFPSNKEAIERADYIAGFGGLSDFGYQIIADTVLLRLNTGFDRSAVEKYAQAIGGEIYSETESNSENEKSDSDDYFLDIENPEIYEAFLNPDKYTGRIIVFEAKVISDVIRKDKFYMFQMTPTDPSLDIFTVIVGCLEDRGWSNGEIHGVTGEIMGSLDGDKLTMVIRQPSESDTKGD